MSAAVPAPAREVSANVGVIAVDLARPRDRRRFIDVPRHLHASHAQYVSPLIRDQMWFLDPTRNPSAEGLSMQAFLAHRGGRLLGRILAFVETRPERPEDRAVGRFGFFDSVNDERVSSALVVAARRWLAERGCARMEGPVDLGIEHGGGVLVEGCERPPAVGAAWNPPYYDALLIAAGLHGQRDLLSWGWQLSNAASTAQLLGRAERTRSRGRLRVRTANMRRLEDELADWHAVFNAAQRGREGCVPLRRRVFDALAYDLSRVAVDQLVLIAEADGRPVGVSVTIPDVTPLLPKSGRLFPMAWLRLFRRRCAVKRGRLRLLSVHPEFGAEGVETLLLAETARAARGIGMDGIDVCWTSEDDHALNHEIRQIGARLDRRYRLYGDQLAA